MPFLDSLNETLGIGRATSGYRSPEEQDDLHRRGVTPLRGGESSHNRGTADNPGAIDIGGVTKDQEAEVRARVEKATGRKIKNMVWETGSGKNQGTGAHFHINFADGEDGDVSQNGQFIGSWDDPAQTRATEQEKAAMRQPRTAVQDVFNPGTTQAAQEAHGEAGQRLGFADQLLSSFIQESKEVRGEQEQLLSRTVEVKKDINNQTREDLKRLTQLATPVWEEREALATRMLELDDMNPLEAGIRGMFDPNYNRNNLRARIRTQDEALGALESVFAEKQHYGQVLASLAQADFNDSSAVADLILANGGEDVRLALQSFNLSSQQLGHIMDGVQTDSALATAKNQARADILSGMSDGQINEALEQATNSPDGIATVNGIGLRTGELMDAQRRLQSQGMSLRLQQLALERGEQDLIDANENNILETMNIADVQRAIQDGYVFKDVPLDPVKVGARLQQLQQTQAAVVAQDSLATAPGLAMSMLNQYSGATKATAARFAGLFGQVPEEFHRQTTADTAQINAFREGLKQAQLTGTEDEYLASQLPVIQGLLESQQKVIETTVKRWSGGNKDLEAVGTAWMTGQPLDTESAMKGLIHMARNGVPAGTQFTGTAANVFGIVQDTIAEFEAKQESRDPADWLTGATSSGTLKEREQALMQELRNNIASGYNQTLADTAFRSIPDMAARIRVDGKPHPFSNVTSEQWNQAVMVGDEAGLEAAANKLSMSKANLKAMIQQGEGGEIWQQVSQGLEGREATWGGLMTTIQANQIQETMSYLNTESDSLGFLPSQQLRDLVNRPDFQQLMKQSDTSNSNSSFGGFLASMAAGGGYAQEVDNLLMNIDSAYTTSEAAKIESRRRNARNLMGNPIARTQFLLGAVSGLSQEHEALLLQEIKQRFGPQGDTAQGIRGSAPSASDLRQMENINAWIMTGRSENPEVDAALKTARRHWNELSPPMEKALDKYFGDQ